MGMHMYLTSGTINILSILNQLLGIIRTLTMAKTEGKEIGFMF